ncbi:MAG: hypothetical protein QOE70_663 [Chthoniobacter sp.]|jgi:(p)ppGpp synthase/HD superfamily hydrolase|nr:hypothetical protein [Chthoniobacter sp.]
MMLLERALQIAVTAHAGQTSKDGSPYILHPLRLMAEMDSDDERIVAILHDVIEDSNLTLADLEGEGFASEVLEAIRLLTHEKSVPYEEHVRRIEPHPLARKVKLADLRDNADLRRMTGDEERDSGRLKKYLRGWMILMD